MDELLKRGIINKGVVRKIGKDVWFVKIVLNEFVVCLVGLYEYNLVSVDVNYNFFK